MSTNVSSYNSAGCGGGCGGGGGNSYPALARLFVNSIEPCISDGTITMNLGQVEINGNTDTTTIKDNLVVNGPITANQFDVGSLSVSGSITQTGGTTSLKGTTIDGNLDVSSNITCDQIEAVTCQIGDDTVNQFGYNTLTDEFEFRNDSGDVVRIDPTSITCDVGNISQLNLTGRITQSSGVVNNISSTNVTGNITGTGSITAPTVSSDTQLSKQVNILNSLTTEDSEPLTVFTPNLNSGNKVTVQLGKGNTSGGLCGEISYIANSSAGSSALTIGHNSFLHTIKTTPGTVTICDGNSSSGLFTVNGQSTFTSSKTDAYTNILKLLAPSIPNGSSAQLLLGKSDTTSYSSMYFEYRPSATSSLSMGRIGIAGVYPAIIIQGSKVAIGNSNTAPTETLDVTGNIKASGSITAGAGLFGSTLNTTGTATIGTYILPSVTTFLQGLIRTKSSSQTIAPSTSTIITGWTATNDFNSHTVTESAGVFTNNGSARLVLVNYQLAFGSNATITTSRREAVLDVGGVQYAKDNRYNMDSTTTFLQGTQIFVWNNAATMSLKAFHTSSVDQSVTSSTFISIVFL